MKCANPKCMKEAGKNKQGVLKTYCSNKCRITAQKNISYSGK